MSWQDPHLTIQGFEPIQSWHGDRRQAIWCLIWTVNWAIGHLLKSHFSALAATSSIEPPRKASSGRWSCFPSNFLDPRTGFSYWNIRTWLTSKLFHNVGVLWRTEYDALSSKVFLHQKFIHTKDCNDILQFMVALKDTFNPQQQLCVVLLQRFQVPRHVNLKQMGLRRGDTQLNQFTFQSLVESKWAKAVAGAGSSMVIRWHVDNLDRGYWTFLGWWCVLCWPISVASAGHSNQRLKAYDPKGEYFWTSLCETEDIINE